MNSLANGCLRITSRTMPIAWDFRLVLSPVQWIESMDFSRVLPICHSAIDQNDWPRESCVCAMNKAHTHSLAAIRWHYALRRNRDWLFFSLVVVEKEKKRSVKFLIQIRFMQCEWANEWMDSACVPVKRARSHSRSLSVLVRKRS